MSKLWLFVVGVGCLYFGPPWYEQYQVSRFEGQILQIQSSNGSLVFVDPCDSKRLANAYKSLHKSFDKFGARRVNRSPFKETHDKLKRLETIENARTLDCRQ